MTKPRVLLISDTPGWAFDTLMHDMAEYLTGFDFEHFYVEEWHRGSRPAWHEYDAVFECDHRNPEMFVPRDRAVGALPCQWFKPECPGSPDDADVALVNRYAAFQVLTKSIYDALAGRCPNAVYLANPVNMRRFPTPTPIRDEVVAEWNGNSKHKSPDGRLIKHYHDIVVPACQSVGVSLCTAEYRTASGAARRRTCAEMPEFYLQANVALCASEYEGASCSVMEAMASGLALVATDVGNHREMHDAQMNAFGDSGILFVDGTVDAFVAALGKLTPARAWEMGRLNRAEIEARWSWDVWASRYAEVLCKVVRP